MVCTTMFVMPRCPILKSKDLCHWELVSYIFNTIEDNDNYHLNMGLGVIAEGVETKNQLDFLNQGMCDEIQGFYYFKPMAVREMEELLKKTLTYDYLNVKVTSVSI